MAEPAHGQVAEVSWLDTEQKGSQELSPRSLDWESLPKLPALSPFEPAIIHHAFWGDKETVAEPVVGRPQMASVTRE